MFFRVLSTECLAEAHAGVWMVLVCAAGDGMLQFAISYKGARVFLHDGKDAWPPMVRQTVEVWTLFDDAYVS